MTPITDEQVNEMSKPMKFHQTHGFLNAQAEILRRDIDAKGYIPCSSLTGYNIDKVIDTALTLTLDNILKENTESPVTNKYRCLLM